ncbi:MAG: hypothetical protein ACP5MT_01960 [Candidatus Acidifodinimicrobium sp.]
MKSNKMRNLYRSEYIISIVALALGLLFLFLTLLVLYNFLYFSSSSSITISKTITGYMMSEVVALIVVSVLLVVFGLVFIYRSRRRLRH